MALDQDPTPSAPVTVRGAVDARPSDPPRLRPPGGRRRRLAPARARAAPLATLEADGGSAEVTVALPGSIDTADGERAVCAPEGRVAVVAPSGDGSPAIAELHLVAP
ncbi:MAG: hypothetical protein R2711_13065 [Acidimicrobiales bacterium]